MKQEKKTRAVETYNTWDGKVRYKLGTILVKVPIGYDHLALVLLILKKEHITGNKC